MSPSRGFRFLPRTIARHNSTTTASSHPLHRLRTTRTPLHIYRSTSTNPFFNLSLENNLLYNSSPASTILYTYINSPCVVLGRNQNPWSELNMSAIASTHTEHYDGEPVQIVRRRSGGGTVYHDLGNLCWSVIMPKKEFHRDKNLHLIVDALARMGVETRINERHDIVLGDRKVSGSAYKLVRERAYHHATLLCDTRLESIGRLLDSPLRSFITAQGVESVRSPVANVGVDKEKFVEELERVFVEKYGKDGEEVEKVSCGEEEVSEAMGFVKEGIEEMKSNKYLHHQTPKFTFTLPPSTPLPQISSPYTTPRYLQFTLHLTNSRIADSKISTSADPEIAFVQQTLSFNRLEGKQFDADCVKDMGLQNPVLEKWLEEAIGAWTGSDGEVSTKQIDKHERRLKRRRETKYE